MDISNNLLSQTIYKSKILAPSSANQVDETQSSEQSSEISDVSNVNNPGSNIQNQQASIYADIKAAIYNYSHPTTSGVTTSYGTDFDSICSYLGVSPTTKITKADLTKKTRNDSLEDANKDFFGALNRSFSYLKPTDTISYNDLMLFFMRGVSYSGRADNCLNFSEYTQVVNSYSNIVQSQYDACATEQEKLEFIINKTKDYLTESRMDLQLNALTRLTVTNAGDNVRNPNSSIYQDVVPQVANVGQIAFANLGGWTDGYITGGAYTSWMDNSPEIRYNSSEVGMWGSDVDAYWVDDSGNKHWGDAGITLNTELYFKTNPYSGEKMKWYEVVGVLVHELTHATAYYYYNYNASTGISKYSQQGLDFMVSKGVISSSMANTVSSDPQLKYLVSMMWDEWAAYSTSCNYWDSIAGDIFDSSDDLAVNGTTEYNAIKNHLRTTGYDYTGDDGLWHERPVPNISYEALSNMFYFA